MSALFCQKCGARLEGAGTFCPQCGANTASTPGVASEISPKSPTVVLLLCIFLGTMGIHRFYVGKIGTGLLMLLTAGGCGIWYLVDLALIVCNDFRDKQGRIVELSKNPSSFKKVMMVFGVAIAGFICFFALLMTIVIFATSGMSSSARSQLHALQVGNIEQAYNLTSHEFQKATSIEDFKKYVQQHPQLTHSRSISFSERSFVNDSGTLKGTLTNKDGSTIPIEYQLKKEEGIWKIQAIRLDSSQSEPESQVSPETRIDNPDNRFSMSYPNNWEYTHPDAKTMLFNLKSNTDTKYTSINIQKLLTKKTGGIYSDLNDLKKDLMKQINTSTQDVTLLSEGKVELPKNPKKFHGISFVVTYTYHGLRMKKMQFLLQRQDEKFLYMWGYTSTIDEYDSNLPAAKKIFESWSINE